MAEARAVEEIRKFQKIKKRAKLEIEAKGEELDGQEDDYGQQLKEQLADLERKLMDIEMALQNVLQEQTKEYIKKVKDMNEYLKGKTNEYLQALNDEIEKYQDDLKMEAYDHLEEWTKQQNANNAGDDYEDDAESAA